MPNQVNLNVVAGPMKGLQFSFLEHDTFIFGRDVNCHACLPDDEQVSRHHFLIETQPPNARICDLGSMNGTYVNNVKHGGRRQNESPEEARRRGYPHVTLNDGDRIRAGQSVIEVAITIEHDSSS